jgi:NADH-quinone oxidoreductase subunit K
MHDMNEAALLENYLLVGGVLFAVGMVGVAVRRNLIVVFLCVEMMLQGVSLSLVAWGRYHNDWGGQTLVLFILAVAACEAAIALALFLALFRQRGSLDVTLWQRLREDDQPPHVDREVPEPISQSPQWPKLTPAGVEPRSDPEKELHRSHV